MTWLKYALFIIALGATQILTSLEPGPGGQPPTCC